MINTRNQWIAEGRPRFGTSDAYKKYKTSKANFRRHHRQAVFEYQDKEEHRIEEAVDGLEGIDNISSHAYEGLCRVSLELVPGVDKGKVSDDVKSRVDSIIGLPKETEKPVVTEVTSMASVLQIAISGKADEHSLKEFRLLPNLRRRLRRNLSRQLM